jgi:nitrite reductase/ring-hydroxylating ferredoxin subunit/uncharacterized membrane protein
MPLVRDLEQAVDRVPVEKVGSASASAIHQAIVRSKGLRSAADVLHGTWLGHPLHPALTDLVIGAWLAGGVFDAVGEWQGSDRARWAGDKLAALGVAAAVPTAMSGLADYSAAAPQATRAATVHGLMNALNFALYGVSLWQRARGNRRRGLALSFTAQGLMLAAAWVGGQLVYRKQMGVDQGEVFEDADGWQAVLPADELADGRPRRVELAGKGVLLYRHDGEVLAIGAVCSHQGGPLEEGRFWGTCVKCPWHDSVFDLRDGRVVHGPAAFPQAAFEVRERGGQIELRHRGK